MYKKFTIVAIMIILFSMIFSPAVLSSGASAADASDGFEIKIFAADSVLQLDFDEVNVTVPAIPNEGYITIPLNISYWLQGVFAKWRARVFRNKDVQVDLTIIDKPEWSEATITPPIVLVDIVSSASEVTPGRANLVVSVNENAPAFTQGKVVIQATCPAIKGLFGIVTKVTGCNLTSEVPFTVGYLPAISIKYDFIYKEVPPLNVTSIPVNITNLGNGRTEVTIEVENESGNYSVNYLKSIVLESPISGKENKKQVEIRIRPYKNFSMEAIKISFTPHYLWDPDLKGKTYDTIVTLKNDGSYKEEVEEFEINYTLLIVVIVVIILVLIFAIILKKRR
ncbi:MAG: hypothetical protein KAW45_03710 [Thermoplasmatales archaeon]|nr:hypothetical protein [Thermoplasmatales archaeon]